MKAGSLREQAEALWTAWAAEREDHPCDFCKTQHYRTRLVRKSENERAFVCLSCFLHNQNLELEP